MQRHATTDSQGDRRSTRWRSRGISAPARGARGERGPGEPAYRENRPEAREAQRQNDEASVRSLPVTESGELAARKGPYGSATSVTLARSLN